MKKIVVNPVNEIRISDLTGQEIVVYQSQGNAGYCILAKLVGTNSKHIKGFGNNREEYRYGFIPLNTSNSNPRFVGNSWHDAVRNAGDNRTLYAFDSMKEMLKALLNDTI